MTQPSARRVEPARRVARRRRRWPWVLAATVIIVGLLGVAGWLGYRVLTVKSELETSLGQVAAIRSGGDVRAGIESLRTHSGAAVDATRDPVWSAAEGVVWVGDNLRAARLAAESAEFLSADVAIPMLDAFDEESQTPLLGRVVPVLSAAGPRVHELSAELADVEASPSLLAQLRDGVAKLTPVLRTLSPMVDLLPGMLGADGARNYLLVAQNNAETLALGGSAASETLIRVGADGAVKIVRQADSQDYNNGKAVDVKIDQSAIDLYNEYLITHVNTTVGRPDFPTAARLIKGFWQRDISDVRIDGVISVDPIGLSGVLKATGPVTVPGWKKISGDNVVATVLSDVYAVATDPAVSDDLFKKLAVRVFDKVAAGEFDPGRMLTAVTDGINGGSILFWSAHQEIQSRVATMRVGGVLPENNDGQTTIGVYYRDASMGSKIDYYMASSARVRATCSADGTTRFSVKVKLTLDLTQAEADKLPAYVRSGEWGSKKFRTQVFIYGPPGTTVAGVKRQHSTGDWNWRPAGVLDLGRPVVSIMMNQTPGGSNTTEAVFEGSGDFGPLKVRTTPMVRATEVSRSDHRCGAK